jgi:ferric-dicitrate binding protein FerR (iron transport regulator)
MKEYAIAIVVIIILLLYFLFPFKNRELTAKSINDNSADLLPGSSRANLTLEDGSLIVLNSKEKDTSINKRVKILEQQGEVIYDKQVPANTSLYNSLTVPRKGQYKLVLQDGTKVWLNAESSIRYPVSFSDTERRVFVTGEAFFEVAKENAKPFRVVVNDITIDASDAKFNINAYANEPFVNATLVEGALYLLNRGKRVILKPPRTGQNF